MTDIIIKSILSATTGLHLANLVYTLFLWMLKKSAYKNNRKTFYLREKERFVFTSYVGKSISNLKSATKNFNLFNFDEIDSNAMLAFVTDTQKVFLILVGICTFNNKNDANMSFFLGLVLFYYTFQK
ncbi:hypothetical protein MHBO_005065 [Bonamia ostreae]|uniref:ATP synthase F0 subunit 8 n=1 Tax=Bonamia ostreae TaxID=126728 RepID=A0ABV2AVK9_9EUKA